MRVLRPSSRSLLAQVDVWASIALALCGKFAIAADADVWTGDVCRDVFMTLRAAYNTEQHEMLRLGSADENKQAAELMREIIHEENVAANGQLSAAVRLFRPRDVPAGAR